MCSSNASMTCQPRPAGSRSGSRARARSWLDDLTLVETSDQPQWYPQIGTEGVTNAIPNSSFECGTAGWGSLTFGLGGWEGNLFRLVGQCDPRQAKHGRQSLRITLDAASSPVYWFDYYQPVRERVKRAFAANRGWIKVEPGAALYALGLPSR